MSSDDLKRSLGIHDDGVYRVDPKTGIVQKESLTGWADTDMRVDPQAGRIEEQELLRRTDTGRRIDPNTGEFQELDLFGYKSGDTRIDPDTGSIQKRDLLGWKDTGERIDPKSGIVQKQGLWGRGASPSRQKHDRPSRPPSGPDPGAPDTPDAAAPGGLIEGFLWSLSSGLSRFLVPIGGLLGLLGGIQWAYEHSYGFQGYVVSVLVGAGVGGMVGSFAGLVLALAALAYVVTWILRACGAPV